jgi:hypothetical protein
VKRRSDVAAAKLPITAPRRVKKNIKSIGASIPASAALFGALVFLIKPSH